MAYVKLIWKRKKVTDKIGGVSVKIAVAGTGYVGLVTGVCLAEHGHQVVCVDIDEKKLEMMRLGKSPIYEEGLEELMTQNASRLTYTTDYVNAYRNAQVIFIGVGTPEKSDGSANLQYVYQVAEQIALSVENNCVVVIKSTVPIGTNDKVEEYIKNHLKHDVVVEVASNPEFLSQGTAVRDTLHASRIIIGTETERAKQILLDVYKEFDAPILTLGRRSAEMVKYASNDFLALKISYINEIANLCEIVGANIDEVAEGMGYDERIGKKFLKAGIGYGGSCFPKDTKALSWLASFNDYELKTVKAAIEVNEQQKLKLLKKARRYYESFRGKTVTVLGLTFKPGTDDLREAPSLINVPLLIEEGAVVKVWDPIGKENFRKLFKDSVEYCVSIEDALKSSDLCMIFTEWDDVKNLNIETYKKLMNNAIVLDGRNCYTSESIAKMREQKITYESIGR